jgi:type IV fimbrial biogenesis protein FimT
MKSRFVHGFSVIELMIVMVMVGVMAAIAAPNLRDLVVRMRVKGAANELHSSLTLARSEAIKRNAIVQVVPNIATDWSKGWSVQAASTVLSRQDAYKDVSFRTANAAYVTVALTDVTFAGTGRETGSAGSGVAVVVS